MNKEELQKINQEWEELINSLEEQNNAMQYLLNEMVEIIETINVKKSGDK